MGEVLRLLDLLRLLLLIVYKVLAMSFEGFVAIMLTALGIMLAVLAIGLAIAAIWGWGEIKSTAAKAATGAIEKVMAEYPSPGRMLELASRMEEILGSWDNIQDKLVSGNAAKEVVPASNTEIQQQAPVAPPYPGEGVQNVSIATTNPEPHDPGPHTAEPGANSG